MGYIKPCAMFNTLWQTGQEGRKKKGKKRILQCIRLDLQKQMLILIDCP